MAEPPNPGGRPEVLVGRLIRVLKATPLARPVPAVSLSVLGLAGILSVGLCAPNSSSIAVELPLTSLARGLGAPALNELATNTIMVTSIVCCCLGLAGTLWANSLGWRPGPRRIWLASVAAVALAVNITPVGSGDVASYAAYGRIAALGHNPYLFRPDQLPGGTHNQYTALISYPLWRRTPSVYGPIATWIHQAAAEAGGSRPWLTIWMLMIGGGLAYLAIGWLLLHRASDPIRAGLLWAVNPLMIAELVIGGHVDSYLTLAAVAAIMVSRRPASPATDLLTGVLLGVGGAIKVNAIFVALGIAVPLLTQRSWGRLARIAAVAAAVTFGLYWVSYGLTWLAPLGAASKLVISPTVWRLIQFAAVHLAGGHQAGITLAFRILWPPLTLALAWFLYRKLSPSVPAVVAATCALTFAWVIVAPWALPWYSSIAWVALALLPRNSLTRWLTLFTGALALLHFNG